MQSSSWVPLVVAALGVLGTATAGVVGVLITQRRADRREQQLWDRERQREREHWAREDMMRTFDQRQRVYVEYYKSLRAMANVADDRANGTKSGPLPKGWGDQTLANAVEMAVFGSSSVAILASDAYYAALQWGTRATFNKELPGNLRENYFKVESALLRLIREELSVPKAGSDRFPV
jgi:hypothetical protein